MLLPIVLLLASAGSMPQTANAMAATSEQFSTPNQNQTATAKSGSDGFVLRRRGPVMPDQGIILPGGNRKACLSITAYVFSDGENPQLQYVTHCPNLDVPYQTKRAHRNGSESDRQPTLRRTATDQ
jgi:hypothetical protein